MNSTKLVVVLGMHRSGTSAVAGALSVLGVRLGDELIQPGVDNPKGFFEDKDIVELNNEMLSYLGKAWFSLFLPSEKDISSLISAGYLEKAKALLRSKTSNAQIFGFKDPRVSKLLGFWMHVFNDLCFEVHYILCVRNPLSVAHSLYTRNKFPIYKGALLWLSYNAAIANALSNEDVLLIDYDRFLHAPIDHLNNIACTFKLHVDEEKVSEGTHSSRSMMSKVM
jgi:hypothetical protein